MTFSKRLILLTFLSLSLISCTKTVYKDRVVPLLPDSSYLQDCPLGSIEGKTVKDVLQLSRDRLLSLENCNVDKQKLRDWKDKYADKPK